MKIRYVLALACLLSGCATMQALGLGTQAEVQEALDTASEFLPAPWGAAVKWGGGIIITSLMARSVQQSEKGKLIGKLNIIKPKAGTTDS